MKDRVIGFVGLGSMGLPMCCNLARSGYRLVVPSYRMEIDASTGYSPIAPDYSSKLEVLKGLLKLGARGAASLTEVVEASDVILISMPTSKQVEELVLSPEGILQHARRGTVVIDLTSADPSSTVKLSQVLAERGIEMMDAPVSGGTTGAINATLSMMVGGNEATFETLPSVVGKRSEARRRSSIWGR